MKLQIKEKERSVIIRNDEAQKQEVIQNINYTILDEQEKVTGSIYLHQGGFSLNINTDYSEEGVRENIINEILTQLIQQ